MQWAQKQKGFTIVELLIVIVVIAILAAITVVAYNGIQARANFSSYQSDLTNTVKLIESYNAVNGSYPTTGGAWSFQGRNASAAARNSYIPGVVPDLASSLPISSNTQAEYVYKSNGRDYKLIRYNGPGIPASEWANVPDSMKDQTIANKDRYGFWTPGGATY